MKRIFILLTTLFISHAASAADSKVLSQSSQSWDGGKLEYPKGEAQLSVLKVTIAPGEELEFHCHPVPSAAYVTSGDIQVILKNGTHQDFHAGDTITEVEHLLHKGKNLSTTSPVELIVFYAGATGAPVTIHTHEPTQNCRFK